MVAERSEPVDRLERTEPRERPVMRDERRERPTVIERRQPSFDPPAIVPPAAPDAGSSPILPPASEGDAERRSDSVASWRSEARDADRWRRLGGDGRPSYRGNRNTRWPDGTEERHSSDLTQPVNPPAGATSIEGHRRVGSDSWRHDWRQDRRYDWRRHREHDRTRFRLGIYIDPFGWSYRRWQPGWNLYAPFYAGRYWINDPYQYRLPPVPSFYRWVRYWNDAILVDLRTGRVIDTIPNFFW